LAPAWSFGADLFSVGIVMYALLANTLPVVRADDGSVGPPDLSARAWWAVSAEAKLLLLSFLAPEPADRPGVVAAHEDAWFSAAEAQPLGTAEARPAARPTVRRGYSDTVLDTRALSCSSGSSAAGTDSQGARLAQPDTLMRPRALHARFDAGSTVPPRCDSLPSPAPLKRDKVGRELSRSCGNLQGLSLECSDESAQLQMDRLARMREAMRRCQAQGLGALGRHDAARRAGGEH
jgi:hypothetical protein